MSDEITTKPFVSQAQAGWAFATGQPWARRWARETGPYKKLPKRKRLKAICTCEKESLGPGVTRIRGNLCNVHGRYGRCPGASSGRVPPKALPKAPKRAAGGRRARGGKRGGAAAKPKKTEEQRQAEQEAKRQERERERQAEREKNRDAVLTAAGLSDEAAGALLSIANGEPGGGDDFGLIRQGLVERDVNGNLRLSEAGRAFMHAADRGDVGAARGALSRGVDRAAAQAERLRKEQERQNKPKGGGGGGGKKRQPRQSGPGGGSTPVRPVGGGGSAGRQTERNQPQLSQELVDAARMVSGGEALSTAQTDLLIRNGLARVVKGVLVLTAAGRKAAQQRTKSFAIFKDAMDAWRWIARTTTAFEDRDREVISTKALATDVARADADGLYGPLRWWHMGRPNPLDATQPWGPGVDLGWCDFNAVSGKTLIESGTFKNEAIARAVAAKADELELSPGFFHAIGEPDRAGVFHHIRRFERSLVPTWAGRASNPYTGLTVEKAMDAKKVQALKELGASDDVINALLADVQTTEKAAEAEGVRYKAFDFFRALFTGEQPATKEAEPAVTTEQPASEPEATPADPVAALKEELAALRSEIVALKEGPPAAEAVPAEATVETQADMPTEEVPIDEGEGGLTLSPDDLDAIGQVIGAVITSSLEPLIGALGITQKLEGHLGELKTMMGGYVKQKDDAQAQQAQAITELKTQVAEIVGDAPRAQGYRASQASDNTLAHALAAAMKTDGTGPSPDDPFADIAAQLFPQLAAQQ